MRVRMGRRAKGSAGTLEKQARVHRQISSTSRSFSASTSASTSDSQAAAGKGASAKKRTSAKGSPTSCRQPLIVPGTAVICRRSLSGSRSLQTGLPRPAEKSVGHCVAVAITSCPPNAPGLGPQRRNDHLGVDNRASGQHAVGVDEKAPEIGDDALGEEDGNLMR